MKTYFSTLIFAALCFLGFSSIASAQSSALLYSERTSWASGTCCAHSMQYKFEVRLLYGHKNMGIDSVFIGEELKWAQEMSAFGIEVFPDEFGARYVIQLEESWNDELFERIDPVDPMALVRTSPYEGVAKIVFHTGEQQHTIFVPHYDREEDIEAQ